MFKINWAKRRGIGKMYWKKFRMEVIENHYNDNIEKYN